MNPRGIFSMHKMISLENNVKEKKNKNRRVKSRQSENEQGTIN